MSKWKWFLVFVLLAGLVLSLAACGGGAEEAEQATEESQKTAEIEHPTVAPQEEATQPPPEEPTEAMPEQPTEAAVEEPTEAAVEEPTEEPTEEMVEEEEELDLGFLGSMADFTSYRSRVTMTISGIRDGDEVEQSIDMIVEQTTDPPAQHISMSGSMLGEEAGFEAIEMYVVGDTMYMQMGDEWMSMPAGEDSVIDEDMLSPDTFIGDSCGWEKQSDTEVLGVSVHHWTVDKSGLEACATEEMLADMGEIDEFNADVYVAIDGGYMVQMDIHYEGEDVDLAFGGEQEEPLDEASLEMHFEYTDVNEPFTIEVPEEAQVAAGLPDDIPLPPEAGNVTNAFGLIMVETTLSGQEVYEFYLAQMPTNGWTQDSADAMGTLFTMEFSKGNRSASFMITTDEDTDVTSVMITVEEPE